MNPVDRLSDSHVAIFLFHGVIEKPSGGLRNYIRKHIEKDYFYKIMKELKGSGRPLSMDEIVEYHRRGDPYHGRSFAITFDDGFENNFSVAAPILKDLKIPAVFYLSTDFIENNHMSWMDRMEYCLENTPKRSLRLPWGRLPYRIASLKDKMRLMEDVRLRMKRDSNFDWDSLISDLFDRCGVTEIKEGRGSLDLKMNWEQVRRLRDEDSFTIGGHSHRHLNMAALDREELKEEIDLSITLLSEKGSVIPRHYSYPEGLEFCYSESVIGALKRRGIICCPTAVDGVNSGAEDMFHLKRIMVT